MFPSAKQERPVEESRKAGFWPPLLSLLFSKPGFVGRLPEGKRGEGGSLIRWYRQFPLQEETASSLGKEELLTSGCGAVCSKLGLCGRGKRAQGTLGSIP